MPENKLPCPTLECEDLSISHQARSALLRLRARVARRPGRWRARMLRRLPPDDGRASLAIAGARIARLVEAA